MSNRLKDFFIGFGLVIFIIACVCLAVGVPHKAQAKILAHPVSECPKIAALAGEVIVASSRGASEASSVALMQTKQLSPNAQIMARLLISDIHKEFTPANPATPDELTLTVRTLNVECKASVGKFDDGT